MTRSAPRDGGRGLHMYTPGDMVPSDAAAMEGEITLRDGMKLHVRPIRSDDTERLRAFHMHLSFESITFRFFHLMPELSLREADHFTHVDYSNRMALVVTEGSGEAEQILAVGRYDRVGPETAEVAFVVQDHWQHHGIATALLHLLAYYARVHGYTTFVATTMSTNTRMLDVFRHSGFPMSARSLGTEVEVGLDIRIGNER